MAPKKEYTAQQMGKAIEAVGRGTSVAAAARQFGVPRCTLRNKVTGKSPIISKMGPQTILTEYEEQVLVEWLIKLNDRHFPIGKEVLLDSVQKIMIESKRENPFTDNRPGRKWFSSFIKRHPEISLRTAQNLTTQRDNVTEANITGWFSEINTHLENANLKEITNDPRRIFNADESAFFLNPKPGKVLVKKGEKHIYSLSGDEKENLTALVCANAAGEMAPPMIVYEYERLPSYISNSVPENWGIGRSDSGWMVSSTFYEYVANVFNPWLEENKIPKPILLFLDGHASHVTLHLSDFGLQNGIEIIALYPNSTHILQPMDVALFKPLKSFWKDEVKKWKLENLGQNVNKENFAPLLKNALSKISVDCIKNGFRSTGLFPFGPHLIDFTKIKNTKKDTDKEDVFLKQFTKYLDSEIVKIFTIDKLNLFNKLYYKNLNSLPNELPPEDLSLYIIWAKNRQPQVDNEAIEHPEHLADGLAIDYPEFSEIDNVADEYREPLAHENTAISHSEPSAVKNIAVEYSEPFVVQNIAIDHPEFSEIDNVADEYREPLAHENTAISHSEPSAVKNIAVEYSGPFVVQNIAIDHPEPSETKNVSVENPETSTIENVATEQDQKETAVFTKEPESVLPDTQLESTLTNMETDKLATKQANFSISPVSNEIINKGLVTPIHSTHDSSTQQKRPQVLTEVLGMKVPTPFKRVLFWPEDKESIKEISKKKRKTEKIPSAVTGKAWQEYHKKKEEKKKQLLDEKAKRAAKRLEKKLLKNKIEEEKKKKATLKGRKQKNTKNSSNKNSETEIVYAESDESDWNEFQHQVLSQDDDFDSENETLLQIASKTTTESIIEGNYVIVNYEGNYFPGRVENIDGDSFEITTMALSSGNSFRWPERPDKIWYRKADIVEKISDPLQYNKRGFYKIKEMLKYLPDIYRP